MCAHRRRARARSSRTNDTDRRRLEITRATIDDAMITYPPLARFPEIEDAGWSAIRDALTGRCTATRRHASRSRPRPEAVLA